MLEKFIFSFNGVQRETPITMEQAIYIARKRAISGLTVHLRIGGVLLGVYSPNPGSPITFTNHLTKETELVECCIVKCVLPKK